MAYLASGVCKGVGAVTAQRIVDRFGRDALDVLENQPEKLRQKSIKAKLLYR